ncbi:hypothetical protein DFJ65_1581 [Calidifontibacter indicus]|uniref:Uncharacterized protein n=1 Tax=Calidifontibacter indicus TaxID=419650 RepID=A0A3D9UML9_9MICO|nr:hypothetical protein DFJ65_1581 [Calidifontibacter indicus]
MRSRCKIISVTRERTVTWLFAEAICLACTRSYRTSMLPSGWQLRSGSRGFIEAAQWSTVLTLLRQHDEIELAAGRSTPA